MFSTEMHSAALPSPLIVRLRQISGDSIFQFSFQRCNKRLFEGSPRVISQPATGWGSAASGSGSVNSVKTAARVDKMVKRKVRHRPMDKAGAAAIP